MTTELDNESTNSWLVDDVPQTAAEVDSDLVPARKLYTVTDGTDTLCVCHDLRDSVQAEAIS